MTTATETVEQALARLLKPSDPDFLRSATQRCLTGPFAARFGLDCAIAYAEDVLRKQRRSLKSAATRKAHKS